MGPIPPLQHVAVGKWSAVVEVCPPLEKCSIILQHRSDSELGEDWSVHVSLWSGTLQILLTPAKKEQSSPAIIRIQVGDEIEVNRDCLRFHVDNICLTMNFTPGCILDKALYDEPSEEVSDVFCRRCLRMLLSAEGKKGLRMPSGMWQSCAEALACEECTPLVGNEIKAVAGCVYTSPNSLLVDAADLRSVVHPDNPAERNVPGLVMCECNAVIGEVALSAGSAELPQPPSQIRGGKPAFSLRRQWRPKWLCSGDCCVSGVILYKQRIAMPISKSAGMDGIEEGGKLAGFTEESAVTAQLIALHEFEGHSRFLLVPKQENLTDDPSVLPLEALELRMVARELAIIGPVAEESTGSLPGGGGGGVPRSRSGSADSGGSGTDEECEHIDEAPAMRASKVWYRHHKTLDPSRGINPAGSGHAYGLVIPEVSFRAAKAVLDDWAETLPASLAPPLPNSHDTGVQVQVTPWQTAYLPLPPRDELHESNM